jgi:N-acetylglucosaminyldiphosphoundecaprenol N-acetyl-beta-D-mannosaminyltransferase
MEKVYFDDLPISVLTLENVVEEIKKIAERKNKKGKIILCLNANNINISYKDKKYRQIIKKADLIIPDGWGVVWAGKILGYSLKERTTTADYFDRFCQMLVDNNFSVYFLGGRHRAIRKAVQVLKNRFPRLRIVDFHSGYLQNKKTRDIINNINKLRPDFLLVGMGTPKQEKWLWQHKDKLKVKVGWGVGAMFDYLAGEKKRCPVWLGRLGFEWTFRFFSEPKRLWSRYFFGSVEFISRCFSLKMKIG